MDVNVKVTVDLGDKTLSIFGGLMDAGKAACAANTATALAADTTDKVQEKEPKEVPGPKKSQTRTRSTKEPAVIEPEPVKEPEPEVEPTETTPAVGFEAMDDDSKLEAIRTEVTKNVKKGKSSDVKFMLAQFDAGKASDLPTESYDAFYDAIIRYGKGEALEEIFPSDLG